MIEFFKYAKIKDNYCISYFGPNDEYLFLLKLLKPIIESHFPGLKLMFCCQDEKKHLLGEHDYVIGLSEIKMRRLEFAHVREIKFNGNTHPIEDLLIESGITGSLPIEKREDHSVICTIITKGFYPTKPLELKEINICKKMFSDQGYQVFVDENVEKAGIVVGVESLELFKAANRGISTFLIPKGIGSRLYKQLFLFGEVLNI